MAKNIKILKLATGEEIMGEVLNVSEANVTLKNVVRVMVVPSRSDPNTPTVAFAPWAEFSAKKDILVSGAHVICAYEPVKEFINQYNAMFGGIIAPKTDLVGFD